MVYFVQSTYFYEKVFFHNKAYLIEIKIKYFKIKPTLFIVSLLYRMSMLWTPYELLRCQKKKV